MLGRHDLTTGLGLHDDALHRLAIHQHIHHPRMQAQDHARLRHQIEEQPLEVLGRREDVASGLSLVAQANARLDQPVGQFLGDPSGDLHILRVGPQGFLVGLVVLLLPRELHVHGQPGIPGRHHAAQVAIPLHEHGLGPVPGRSQRRQTTGGPPASHQHIHGIRHFRFHRHGQRGSRRKHRTAPDSAGDWVLAWGIQHTPAISHGDRTCPPRWPQIDTLGRKLIHRHKLSSRFTSARRAGSPSGRFLIFTLAISGSPYLLSCWRIRSLQVGIVPGTTMC
jgi:hypothetical protein